MGIAGSQVGFDEGGVLQALATPIFTREVSTEKKLKSGKIKRTVTKIEVTGAHILALAMGSMFLELFLKGRDQIDAASVDSFLDNLPWYTLPGLAGRLYTPPGGGAGLVSRQDTSGVRSTVVDPGSGITTVTLGRGV